MQNPKLCQANQYPWKVLKAQQSRKKRNDRQSAPVVPEYYALFDGVDHDVAIPEWTPTTTFYIEAYIVPAAIGSAMTIVSGTPNSSYAIVIDVTTGGAIRFFAYTSALQSPITSSTILSAGNTYKVRAVLTANAAELFIDDVSQGTKTWALAGSSDISYIGSRAGSSNFFNGKIYDVDLNGEHLYHLKDGYSAEATAVDAVAGANGTYRNFADTDYEVI